MKTLKVVAAVLCDSPEHPTRIYATAKGYGKLKGFWEFPGGKIEEGETPLQALRREIWEELETEIDIFDLIDTVEYDYPDFHLSMACYRCMVTGKEPTAKEAAEACWLSKGELYDVPWLPADIALIEKIKKIMR